ncbi:MAG: hypothetical protein ACYC2O_05865 [Microthrixaceae bacterium]
MTKGRRTGARRGSRGVVVAGCAVLALGLIAGTTACIPDERGPVDDIDDGSDSARAETSPPEFPIQGEIPADLLVDGIVYDLTTRPRDQDYWSPSTPEARCAAKGIVEGIGPGRLSQLGYRVATPGASLNDIALTDDEHVVVVDRVMGCVDMVEGVASLLFGDGRIPTNAAVCVAEALGERDMLRPFVEAWSFGRPVDPFAGDAAFASIFVSAANVCVADTAFLWPDVRVADEEPLIDADLPAGSTGSAYADDRKDNAPTTTPTSAVPTTAPAG